MNSSPIHESLVRAQLEPSLSPWRLSGARIRQSFDEPDEIVLRLVTDDATADASELLGQNLTLTFTRRASQQEWSGIVESVEDGASDRQLQYATVTVVSALVALRHRTDCRVFQDLTVPAILEDVLNGAALSPAVALGYRSRMASAAAIDAYSPTKRGRHRATSITSSASPKRSTGLPVASAPIPGSTGCRRRR